MELGTDQRGVPGRESSQHHGLCSQRRVHAAALKLLRSPRGPGPRATDSSTERRACWAWRLGLQGPGGPRGTGRVGKCFSPSASSELSSHAGRMLWEEGLHPPGSSSWGTVLGGSLILPTVCGAVTLRENKALDGLISTSDTFS